MADGNPPAEACVVMTTCGSEAEAASLAKLLLDARLAACVQVVDIRSRYWWRGSQAEEAEKLLLVKTRAALYPEVEAAIRAGHSYEVPEVICLPAAGGSRAYLDWIAEVTAGG